jgi:hypothetical protein
VRAGAYSVGTLPPGGEAHAIAEGDGNILDQYIAAIDAAREAIYIENRPLARPW